MYYYAKNVIEELKKSAQLVVFGAGIMALDVIGCLSEKPYPLQIECCLVSDISKNSSDVKGIPVMDFTMAENVINKDATVLVAAVEKNLESMMKCLCEKGYLHLIPLTYESDLWSLIRGNHYREYCRTQRRSYLTLEEELRFVKDQSECQTRRLCAGSIRSDGTDYLMSTDVIQNRVSVYTTRCHMDRKLQEDVTRYSWEIPIQAGAALTKERICKVCDDTGDHISYKNKQYCELTALYWIWKNDKSDYVGLGHYRRHFEVTREQLERLAGSDIDVVLTIPIFDYPSVEAVYRRDHVWDDWEIMCEAVSKISPEYVDTLSETQKGRYYYAYNMFIMRRKILETYCEWLFPILFYCEEHCKEKKDRYQNRYIGFLAEHLMSVYFMHHEKEYKIVHARKHFIEG